MKPTFLQRLRRLTAPSYGCFRAADGADDLWRIAEARSGRTLATILFWDDDDDWAASAEADARRIVAALNAYRAPRRSRPPAPRRGDRAYCYVLRDHEHELLEIVESANGRTLVEYDLAGLTAAEFDRTQSDARLIARALNSAHQPQGVQP